MGTDIFPSIGHRGGALLLDLVVIVFVAAMLPAETPYRTAAILAFAFAYFAFLPLTRLQGTPGKWICRIRLCDRAGKPLTLRRSALRAGTMLGWCALPGVLDGSGAVDGTVLGWIWFIVPVPWATTGFLPRKESLFDLLCGSLVVRVKSDPATLSESGKKPRVRDTAVALFATVLAGVVISVPVSANRDKDRRVRIVYALEETKATREKMEAFYRREGRWAGAQALGVPEWNPYPAGGGYRVHDDGRVVITFAVLPDLKGRSITLRPEREGEKIAWKCKADAGIEKLAPGSCR